MDFLLELLLPEKWESSFWMNLFAYIFILASGFVGFFLLLANLETIVMSIYHLLSKPLNWVTKILNMLRFLITKKTLLSDYEYLTARYKMNIFKAICENMGDKKLLLHISVLVKSDPSITEDNEKFFDFIKRLTEPEKIGTYRTEKLYPKLWKELSLKQADKVIDIDNTEINLN